MTVEDSRLRQPGLIQLPLGVGLREGPSLGNFEPGPNGEALAALRLLARGEGPTCTYLWGAAGCGKTHLLEALCRARAGERARAGYLPLGRADAIQPGILAGFETLALLCLDEVDAVAAEPAWEEALFHLYIRCEQTGTALAMAGRRGPGAAGFGLADLASRLTAGAVFRLRPLDDHDRGVALRRRARERGFEIPDEVLAYVLRRRSRDMHSLFTLLERLDHGSLAAKRRVTIPFVRDLLEG
jgi:DnaA family protein